MIRLTASSALVLSLAVASALSTAFWLDRLDGRAQATPAVAEIQRVARDADGHYWTRAMIDGAAIRVMVDTGSSQVALTQEDAARLGLIFADDAFTVSVRTASGPVMAAPVTLASVTAAGARVEKVQALVVRDGLPHSLLGMSYLGRLSRFEATPQALTLAA